MYRLCVWSWALTLLEHQRRELRKHRHEWFSNSPMSYVLSPLGEEKVCIL